MKTLGGIEHIAKKKGSHVKTLTPNDPNGQFWKRQFDRGPVDIPTWERLSGLRYGRDSQRRWRSEADHAGCSATFGRFPKLEYDETILTLHTLRQLFMSPRCENLKTQQESRICFSFLCNSCQEAWQSRRICETLKTPEELKEKKASKSLRVMWKHVETVVKPP